MGIPPTKKWNIVQFCTKQQKLATTKTFEETAQLHYYDSEMSSEVSSCSSDDVERSAHEATAGYKLRKRSRETRNRMQRMARGAIEEDEDYFSDSSSVPPPKRAKSHVRVPATKRERARMHKLNNAYDKLRRAVPKLNSDVGSKLSKIATLRLAIDYITMLSNFLEGKMENEERPETLTNSDGDTTSSTDDDSDILAKLIDSVVEEFGWFLGRSIFIIFYPVAILVSKSSQS